MLTKRDFLIVHISQSNIKQLMKRSILAAHLEYDMRKQYFVTTNELYYAYWSKVVGVWSAHDTFEADCLLDEDEAQAVQRMFNASKDENDPAWVVKEGWLEIPK